MSRAGRIKPKYGVNRTFSRFARRRGGLQLMSMRERGAPAPHGRLAFESMTDRRKEGAERRISR
jgi:hypothetical protein